MWFLFNIGFVVSIIIFMFMHRSYSLAKGQLNNAEQISRLNRWRKLLGLLSIFMFVAMAASFVINMRLNG